MKQLRRVVIVGMFITLVGLTLTSFPVPAHHVPGHFEIPHCSNCQLNTQKEVCEGDPPFDRNTLQGDCFYSLLDGITKKVDTDNDGIPDTDIKCSLHASFTCAQPQGCAGGGMQACPGG